MIKKGEIGNKDYIFMKFGVFTSEQKVNRCRTEYKWGKENQTIYLLNYFS